MCGSSGKDSACQMCSCFTAILAHPNYWWWSRRPRLRCSASFPGLLCFFSHIFSGRLWPAQRAAAVQLTLQNWASIGVSIPHSLIFLFPSLIISFFNSSTALRDTSSRLAVTWKLTASMQGGRRWRWLMWNSSWEGKGKVLLTTCFGGLCCTDSPIRLSLPRYAHKQCFHCECHNLWLVLCDTAWLFVPKTFMGLNFYSLRPVW